MFYIPETKEEMKKLIDEIINRMPKGPAKLDGLYLLAIAEAFYKKED